VHPAAPRTRMSKNISDSRSYQTRLERELVIGALLIGLVVGIGLIYLFWGAPAAVTGLLCFGLFLGIVAVVWGFLQVISWLGERE
jgi:hypothetical protein